MTIAVKEITPADVQSALRYSGENAQTGEVLKAKLGLRDTRTMRRMMAELRHQDIPVLGGSKGYFIAGDLKEIDEARERLLDYIKALCIDLRDLKRIRAKYAGQIAMKL